MPRLFTNGVDLGSQRGQHAQDPSVSTDLATKNYVDTTTPGVTYGGYGEGDVDIYGDLLSTFPRTMMQFVPTASSLQIGSTTANQQQAFILYAKRAFPAVTGSTGVRYLTGNTAASGQTIQCSVLTGVSLASMTLQKTLASVAFSATNSLVQAAWGSVVAVPVGYVALVFTASAIQASTAARFMTSGQANLGGTGFMAPSTSNYRVAARSGTSLTSPINFTTGWTTGALVPWVALY